MSFSLSKNFFSTFVALIFAASSGFGGKYVILKSDGTYHDVVKVNGVWERADGTNDRVSCCLAKTYTGIY